MDPLALPRGGTNSFDGDARRVVAGATALLDGVACVPAVPHAAFAQAASTGRGVVSRTARALAAPLLLVTVGIGTVVVICAGPADEGPVINASDAPVKSQLVIVAFDDQTPSQLALGPAGSSGKPNQSAVLAEQPVDVVAAPAAAQPGETTEAPVSSGIAASDPATSDLPSPARPSGAMAPALAAEPTSSPVVSTSVPSTPSLTSDVPPSPPRPAAQSSVSETPRQVSSMSVKPGGMVGSNGQPDARALTPVEPLAITSADTTTSMNTPSAIRNAKPPVKKPILMTRAKRSAIGADNAQTVKTTKPLASAAKANVDPDNTVRNEGDAGAPLLITPQALPDRIVDASAAPTRAAQPAATKAGEGATGSSSFSIRLASSLSESDARATLSRLQKQLPGALANGSIRREDLGSEGVFYRVRVGPLSREAADKICSRLRAVGKSCILTAAGSGGGASLPHEGRGRTGPLAILP
jgi:hypothetical protein